MQGGINVVGPGLEMSMGGWSQEPQHPTDGLGSIGRHERNGSQSNEHKIN